MKRKEVVGVVGLVGLVPSQPPVTKWLDPTLQKGEKKIAHCLLDKISLYYK